jgi:phosphoribosylformylglycinamidine cyclo-ligase
LTDTIFKASRDGAHSPLCQNLLCTLCPCTPSKPWRTSLAADYWKTFPRFCRKVLLRHLKKGSWPQSELFAWLQQTAGIDDIEMNRTFNNGIGMVVVIDAANAQACAETLRQSGEKVYQIGVIAAQGDGAQVVVN